MIPYQCHRNIRMAESLYRPEESEIKNPHSVENSEMQLVLGDSERYT